MCATSQALAIVGRLGFVVVSAAVAGEHSSCSMHCWRWRYSGAGVGVSLNATGIADIVDAAAV